MGKAGKDEPGSRELQKQDMSGGSSKNDIKTRTSSTAPGDEQGLANNRAGTVGGRR